MSKAKSLLVIKLSLVLILGYLVVRTVLTRNQLGEASSPGSAVGAEEPAVETPGSHDSQAQDYSAIVERDVFGSPDPTTPPVAPAPARVVTAPAAPEQLNIALLGTIAGSPEISRAIVQDLGTNVITLYRIGDRVATARIESIEKNLIVLSDNGRRRTLEMETREAGSGGAGKMQEALPNKTVRAPEASSARSPYAHQLRNVEALLRSAVIKPHVVDGQVEGLRITGLENILPAKDLGLKEGDVIRSVNGHLLSNKQQAFQISQKARSQPNLSIELVRGKRTTTLSFPLR
jgi:general secretion pathway protein C